ncbi:MAG: hypothetical protein ACKVOQ_09670 [Cyclobacteriaceae bacterium]|jgi:hypothetical protein
MPRFKTICTITLLVILGTQSAFSQVRKSPRSARYGVPKVSRGKAIIMCPIFVESKYPYQGIGFKLGDPFALTYKYYPSKQWSFAVDAGKAASGLYNKYYREAFNSYLPDTLGKKQAIQYFTHTVPFDWFLEAKFLYQWDAEKISKGLQLYAGLGWQWRNTTIDYQFLRISDTSPSSFGGGKLEKFSQNRFTYGPVILVGFEYSYFTLPISAFIEVEMFTDALIDPGYQRFQGGVGLRYVF